MKTVTTTPDGNGPLTCPNASRLRPCGTDGSRPSPVYPPVETDTQKAGRMQPVAGLTRCETRAERLAEFKQQLRAEIDRACMFLNIDRSRFWVHGDPVDITETALRRMNAAALIEVAVELDSRSRGNAYHIMCQVWTAR